MQKLLLAGVALLSLSIATPALADSKADAGAVVGGTAAGVTGGTIGFLVGGPIGAVVGGFTGAVIGAEAGVSASTVEFAANHPVDPIVIDGSIDVGYEVGSDVKIYPVEGDDAYGYFYANDRVYIVDLKTRKVVQSPGYLIPSDAMAYVEANPTTSVEISGEIGPGVTLDSNVQVAQIPDAPAFGYVYLNDRPVIVDSDSRTVIWVK